MKEIWKDIANSNYQVSNLGRVRNSYNKILKPLKTKGYSMYRLTIEGKCKSYPTLRLVAMNFLGITDRVTHKDGNKDNNSISNIEIGKSCYSIDQYDLTGNYIKTYKSIKYIDETYRSRIYHCIEHHIESSCGYIWTKHGETPTPKYKYKYAQYTKGGLLIGIYNSIKEIDKVFGKRTWYVTLCCQGKAKSAYGYIWKYV